ncbi:MAG: flagellar type III secretion system protein FliR [Deltaproteobacteria bacterium]|nr:flagellar type III secretion system protein FliR [Deltaproteobacteria bacterium]MBW1914978.1 flagellar type III secretion system protein FliR [Deltaproteobacteria bacterium]
MVFPMESFAQMQGFFWVLVRISIILFLMPFFGARGIPVIWKAGLSLMLAMILTPVVPLPDNFPNTMLEIVLSVISEMLIGVVLAFTVRILFASVQMAGQFISFQMGFAMARAMDPQTGNQTTVLSQFLYLLAVLIFFTIDGHHLFIHALVSSFHSVPLNSFSMNSGLADVIIRGSCDMFIIGIKIAAPIMVALFLSNLSLGIVARTVPQVNILMIGFPINICIGLVLFGLVLRNLPPFFSDAVRYMGRDLVRLIHLM